MARAKRTAADLRKKHILKEAAKLSLSIGYKNVTRDRVAEMVGVTSSLIAKYFPLMKDLKDAIMDYALDKEMVPIIAQGLIQKDPRTKKLPIKLRKKVVDYLLLT